MSVSVTVEEITPQIAAEIMEKNTNNRNVRKSRIETYARDMAAGQWKVNGDPIRFNGDGKLLDGQHRLMACVLAQKSFTTAVAHGLSGTAHSTIDTGLNRTLSDELRWAGERNCAELAAMLNLIWGYETGSQWSRVASRNDLLTLLKKQPAIRESDSVLRLAKKIGIRPTALAAAHYLMVREHGVEAAEAFIRELEAGTGYVEGDPCLALRNWAATAMGSRLHRPNSQEWFAVCIKGMNHWLLGRPTKALRWRRVGPAKEAFPQMVGADEV